MAAAFHVTFLGTHLNRGSALGAVSQLYSNSSHPKLTQVPPSRLLSTAIVLAPHCPLALRADARPPLPPPITR